MAMTYGLLFLFLALVAPAVNGVDHTVGGSDGWSQSADLSTWSSGQTFNVGDNLVFNYDTSHSLDIVSKDDYDKCTKGKALKTFNSGPTTIPLPKTGPMYFICPTLSHCSSGMKLAITVVASATTTNPPSTTTNPPSTTTPSGDTSPSIVTPPSGYSSDGNTNTKSDKGGVDGQFGNFNRVMAGFALVVAGLVSFMS